MQKIATRMVAVLSKVFSLFFFLGVSLALDVNKVLTIPANLNYNDPKNKKIGIFIYMAIDDSLVRVTKQLASEKGIILRKIQAASPDEKDQDRINSFFLKLKTKGKSFLSELCHLNNMSYRHR